jgi:serine/threonine protein phosphatase 1
MSTFAIGDVHGNLAALERVLELVGAEVDPGDTVVFLGDYIDRGPNTAQCIDLILDFQRTCPAHVAALLGNHEDWLLRSLHDHSDHCWLLATNATRTIESYSPDAAAEIKRCAKAAGLALYQGQVALPYDLFVDALWPGHLQFLKSLQTYHRTADVMCVHGGLDPSAGPPEMQDRWSLIWGMEGFQHRYAETTPLVYGHWSNALISPDGRVEPLVVGRTIGIDSIKAGTLTAIKMPEAVLLESNGSRSWIYSSLSVRRLARLTDV